MSAGAEAVHIKDGVPDPLEVLDFEVRVAYSPYPSETLRPRRIVAD